MYPPSPSRRQTPPPSYARNHAATVPHVQYPLSKTVNKTYDLVHAMAMADRPPRDELLSRKARRLRSFYGTGDLVHHPDLRTRLVHTPEETSRAQRLVAVNLNVVHDSHVFRPTLGPKTFNLPAFDADKFHFTAPRHSLQNKQLQHQLYGGQSLDHPCTTSTTAFNTNTPNNPRPFYAPGPGLGPVGSHSHTARYGPSSSIGGHSLSMDRSLVLPGPSGGPLSSAYGASYYVPNASSLAFGGSASLLASLSAAARDAADYDTGGGGQSGEESRFEVPRGVARALARQSLSEERLHGQALERRRKQVRKMGRWLQGKGGGGGGSGSSSGPSVDYYDDVTGVVQQQSSTEVYAATFASTSMPSVFTQYDPAASNVSAGASSLPVSSSSSAPSFLPSAARGKHPSQFAPRVTSYGELASQFLGLQSSSVHTSNPYRKTMSLSSDMSSPLNVNSAGSLTSIAAPPVDPSNPPAAFLTRAVAKSLKSLILEGPSKVSELAALGTLLVTPPNSIPGHEGVLVLGRELRKTAEGNPNPEVISRSQLVSVLTNSLVGVDVDMAHRLYSTLDPAGRGQGEGNFFCNIVEFSCRRRYESFSFLFLCVCGCVVVSHKHSLSHTHTHTHQQSATPTSSAPSSPCTAPR